LWPTNFQGVIEVQPSDVVCLPTHVACVTRIARVDS
jgi:hypothetical protein